MSASAPPSTVLLAAARSTPDSEPVLARVRTMLTAGQYASVMLIFVRICQGTRACPYWIRGSKWIANNERSKHEGTSIVHYVTYRMNAATGVECLLDRRYLADNTWEFYRLPASPREADAMEGFLKSQLGRPYLNPISLWSPWDLCRLCWGCGTASGSSTSSSPPSAYTCASLVAHAYALVWPAILVGGAGDLDKLTPTHIVDFTRGAIPGHALVTHEELFGDMHRATSVSGSDDVRDIIAALRRAEADVDLERDPASVVAADPARGSSPPAHGPMTGLAVSIPVEDEEDLDL